MAKEFSVEKGIVFLCGHYEGVDERVLDEIVTDEVSIGDFVLTGGELPAMCMMDAISRMIPGVLHNGESAEDDSFGDGLLEFPQYTRPEIWNGRQVPPILLSGDHAKVDLWRREQSLKRTALRRPDLLNDAAVSPKEQEYIKDILANEKRL
jgi:tRNA (guanine37-N1)-methyltransferase